MRRRRVLDGRIIADLAQRLNAYLGATLAPPRRRGKPRMSKHLRTSGNGEGSSSRRGRRARLSDAICHPALCDREHHAARFRARARRTGTASGLSRLDRTAEEPWYAGKPLIVDASAPRCLTRLLKTSQQSAETPQTPPRRPSTLVLARSRPICESGFVKPGVQVIWSRVLCTFLLPSASVESGPVRPHARQHG